jgi:beta-fructofuranosidase
MPQNTGLYRPADGWFGDVMPIYVDGAYHLFYTFLHKDDKGGPGILKGLDWAHVTTRDFLDFQEQPMAIRRGDDRSPDLLAGAGSVVDAGDGTYVAFYGGINPARSQWGEAEQVVLRAVSSDLETWTKDESFMLEADQTWYERHDWRDPQVYRDGDVWRMLLCARVPDGPFDRRGAVGQATSTDLVHWTVEPPLLSPGITRAPECEEVFDLEGHRYLVYSTYSDRFQTRHRIINADGSTTRPAWDALESNDVYAMSTVAGPDKRILIGWLSTRAGNADTGHRQWGGDLVAHELHARADGTLGAHPLPGFFERFSTAPVTPAVELGDWTVSEGAASFSGGHFGWVSAGASTDLSTFEVEIDLGGTAEEIGVAIHATAGMDAAYLLRIERERGRVVFDRRPHRIDVPFDEHSDRSYVSAADHEIERPLIAEGGAVRVRIVVDGSAIICYVGDVALTTRGYDLDGGVFGLYAANGTASFRRISTGSLA